MNPKRRVLSENAQKVYDYLVKVQEASKDKIRRDTRLTLEGYLKVKNELVRLGWAKGIRSRLGGLRLSSNSVPKKTSRHHPKKRTISKANKGKLMLLSKKGRALFKFIPEDGRSVTNQYLRFRLRRYGVSYDQYYDLRKELLEKKLIILGAGRGGIVSRKLEEPISKLKRPKEDYALYQKLKEWLEKDGKRNIDQQKLRSTIFAVVTASPSGYKQRSGRWSRPDVMLISFNSYPLLIKKTDMTVKTYEVKMYRKQLINDPANVFEAASHQKGAHYSYLVIALLGEDAKGIEGETAEAPEKLIPLLERFGVGFAWFYMTKDGTYDMNIVRDAERQNPDPADENEMVENMHSNLPRREKLIFEKWARA